MSAPSKSPTRTRAKATSVPDLKLDLLGLIPPLGCPLSGQAALLQSTFLWPGLTLQNPDLLPVLL